MALTKRRVKRGKEIDRELEKYAQVIESEDYESNLIDAAAVRSWIGKLRPKVVVEYKNLGGSCFERLEFVEVIYYPHLKDEAELSHWFVFERESDRQRICIENIWRMRSPLSDYEKSELDAVIGKGKSLKPKRLETDGRGER